MTTTEFSNEFDILYNNIMSNGSPGLTEYEKSVFLTQAQESLVIGFYNGKLTGESFEVTEEVRTYISNLVKQATLSLSSGNSIVPGSVFYTLPDDCWFITYESAILSDSSLGCQNNKQVIVKPVTQDDFYRVSRNPFLGANYRRVLRLTSGNKSELISKYSISNYTIRYLTRPTPIILTTLSGGLTINGQTAITECQLDEAIHRTILEKAVQLAKLAWMELGKTQ